MTAASGIGVGVPTRFKTEMAILTIENHDESMDQFVYDTVAQATWALYREWEQGGGVERDLAWAERSPSGFVGIDDYARLGDDLNRLHEAGEDVLAVRVMCDWWWARYGQPAGIQMAEWWTAQRQAPPAVPKLYVLVRQDEDDAYHGFYWSWLGALRGLLDHASEYILDEDADQLRELAEWRAVLAAPLTTMERWRVEKRLCRWYWELAVQSASVLLVDEVRD